MPPRLTRNTLLTSLLIWALLLCHGAFGSLHLTPDPAFQPDPAGEHPTTHHPSGAPEKHPAFHHADAEYFAVLLGTFLGGLALWLLLRNDRRRDSVFSAPRSAGSSPATVSNLPRGPTLPFLQMLRM